MTTLSSDQKMCMALLAIGALVSVVGMASPYWEYTSITGLIDISFEVGLIYYCYKIEILTGIDSDCKLVPWDLHAKEVHEEFYFKAVRVFMILSLIFMIVSVGLILSSCCREKKVSSFVLTTITGTFGGLTGVVGVVIYAIWSKENYIPEDVDVSRIDEEIDLHKGWSFYLCVAGSSMVMIVSLISFCLPRQQGKYSVHTSPGYGLCNPVYGIRSNVAQYTPPNYGYCDQSNTETAFNPTEQKK